MSNEDTSADDSPEPINDPAYGPNPELYEKLAKPRASKEEADRSLKSFFVEVKKLRELYGIPELLILAGVHHEVTGKKSESAFQTVCFGSPEVRPYMGAIAYNMYTKPAIDAAEQLAHIATTGRRKRK
jgi:hypothetical protein